MSRNSLRIRLLGIQAVTIVIALGLTGWGLTYLFERHVARRIGVELDTYITQIAARVTFETDGRPVLADSLADPRFDRIYGGLYWQIDNETAKISTRSRSLWDTRLGLAGLFLSSGQEIFVPFFQSRRSHHCTKNKKLSINSTN